jgi:hypothetical protein
MSTAPALALFLADDDRHRIDGERNSTPVRDLHAANQQHIAATEEFLIGTGEPAILLGTDTEANPIDNLLHALANSLTAVLMYFAAARSARLTEVEPEENLREVVARARKRLGYGTRGRGADTRRPRLHEPRDRRPARNQRQNRRAPRRPHPAQAPRAKPTRSGRNRARVGV